MSLFNSQKTNTTQTTNNNLTDNRVASTGGIAAGQGASVTVNDISADVANSALAANTDVTKTAISGVSFTAQTALDANRSVALDSISAQNRAVDQALNFAAVEGSGSRELALSALKSAGGQALPESLPQSGLQTLVSGSSSATNPENVKQIAKYAAIGLGAIAAAIVIAKLVSKK